MNTELSRRFIDVIPRTMNVIRAEVRGIARDRLSGFSMVQFRVLAQLWQRPMTNSELADLIGVSVPAMSRLVDGLARRGVVSRRTKRDDRRQVSIQLTESGRSQFAELNDQAVLRFAECMQSLDADQKKKLKAGLEVLESLAPLLRGGTLALLMGLGLMSATAQAQPAAAQTLAADSALTLREALEQALAKNPQVQRARERIRESEASVSLAYASILPNLNASLNAQHRKDALYSAAPLFEGNPYNFYQFGFTLSQPLIQGGALWSGIALARQDRELSRLERSIAERDLSQRVILAFSGILLQQERLEALVRNEKVSRDFVEETRRRNRIGRSRKLDVLQARTQVALLTPQIAQARNQMRISGTELATLIGSAGKRELRISGRLDAPDWETVRSGIAEKNVQRPELVRAQKTLERFDDQVTLTMARHWPSVNAVGTYGRSAFVKTDLFDTFATAWTVGLQVSVPLFSGLSSIQERSVLASRLRQLEGDRLQTTDSVTLERVAAQQQLEIARETIASAKLALELAQESLKEAGREYGLGTVDYQQLLVSQQSLLNADVAYAQSRYDYVTSLVKYFVAFGHELGILVRYWTGEK